MNKITYSLENIDSYSGQENWEAGIYLNDEIIGLVEFVTFSNELTISNIFIRPEYRRQGYGSRLMKYILTKFNDYKYIPSMKTEDGIKFKHKDIDLYENKKNNMKNKLLKESLNEFVTNNDLDDMIRNPKINRNDEKLNKLLDEIINQFHKRKYPINLCCWEINDNLEVKSLKIYYDDAAEITINYNGKDYDFYYDATEDIFQEMEVDPESEEVNKVLDMIGYIMIKVLRNGSVINNKNKTMFN